MLPAAGNGQGPPSSPVRQIPPDDQNPPPAPGIALCLSGGGYRAMLFHLGTLWRLNELGYLPKLDRVSSVSGGSITAAVLGMNWSGLALDPVTGVGAGFGTAVVAPIRALARKTIDLPAVLMGMLSLGLLGSQTAVYYRRHLFGEKTLQDFPNRPKFILNATSMQSGALWRFSKPYMADWRVGTVSDPQVPLAVAVAASSAFPPFLSPVILHRQNSDFVSNSGTDLQRLPFTTRIVLTDGGVYDNLGLETAWKNYQTILVSDACGQNRPVEKPPLNWLMQAYRTLMVIDQQVGSLRKRQVIGSFEAGDRKGTYWGIGGHVHDYQLPDAMPCPPELTANLAGFETRLRTVDEVTQQRLINWGYAICDTAMRRHVVTGQPAPSGFPYPESGLG
ncbi:MAG TPA: patatin-like phospholipase family protein [Candidatus Dormibacteraeota bacterium]|nr:patatin-like phospholipase family protein [Candidatus Dormibacteraeota bacterium]